MTSDNGESNERIRAVKRTVDAYLSQVESGASPQIDAIVEANPKLAPELAAEFDKLRLIEAAKRRAENTVDLQLRTLRVPTVCPHCGSPSQATLNDSSGDTRCNSCGRPLSVQRELTLLGAERIGRYTLVERLGAGAFGLVWKAKDPELQRFVALKIPRRIGLDDVAKEQFRREARALAQLRHPHIVSVHEVGEDDGTIYIASDYIQGTTLSQHLKQQRLAPREVAQLCSTVAEALEHAHQAGIIHRDLKPSNIMIDKSGQPYVMDFGLAKRISDDITATVEGQIMGTPAYLSPEQARGDAYKADARSDVYSLGVVLYELLTGQLPFLGTLGPLLRQIVNDEPRRPRRLDKRIPRDLETICLKAMSKQPEMRYHTAGEMADDLQRHLQGLPIGARRTHTAERVYRWVLRKPAMASVIALSVVLVATLFAVAANQHAEFRSTRQQVVLATEPMGANVVFIPRDPRTGEYRTSDKIAAGPSPVTQWLLPGDYLVVAYTDPENFHEVTRHVPDFGEVDATPPPYKHRRWSIKNQRIELPKVVIWNQAKVTEGMAFVKGGGFEMGSAMLAGEAPPHKRSVPDYYVDDREVTVGDYRRENQNWNPPSTCLETLPPKEQALSCVSYDQAMSYCERTGKRLPDETEFEFVAARSSDALSKASEPDADQWQYGRAGQPDVDQVVLANGDVLYGLFSNVAEWTSSWFTPYPRATGRLPVPETPDRLRVVRGGTPSVVNGVPDPADWQRGPRYRHGLPRNTWAPGLGLRCVRSAQPRLTEADFVVIDADSLASDP